MKTRASKTTHRLILDRSLKLLLILMLIVVIASPSPVRLSAAEATTTSGKLFSIQPGAVGPDGSVPVKILAANDMADATLKVTLNGADVTQKFSPAACGEHKCLTASFQQADGMRNGKNVLTAQAKTMSGALLTARARIDARPSVSQTRSQKLQANVLVAQALTDVATPFMPPTVQLQTNYNGGYDGNPWLTIGNQQIPATYQQIPATTPASCEASAVYVAVVLDRQTLVLNTDSPPQCFSNTSDFNGFLKGLPAGNLVIAGTTQNHDAVKDNGTTLLNTSTIGGTDYSAPGLNYPAGYIIVGVSGAVPGTAFEPHYTKAITSQQISWPPTLSGILQEDANGDYNFFAGDVLRYAVVPNSPSGAFNNNAAGPITSVQMSLTQVQQAAHPGIQYLTYHPDPSAQDGFWLLLLNRGTAEPMSNCSTLSAAPTILHYYGCGTFYPTNTSTHPQASAAAAMTKLAADLKAANQNPWQLVILTTVGNASCCDWNTAKATGTNYLSLMAPLQALGGTPQLASFGRGQNSTNMNPWAYTLVTASGLGVAVSANTVESSTVLLNSHGQTGTVTGTLERSNSAGLLQPSQNNQEYTQVLISKGGLDNQFITNTVALQPPVAWPARNPSVLLTGADSISGQFAAYRFISASLLRNKYAVGIAGPHQDDLHYFFTGSLNTAVSIYNFDPANLPWPGAIPAAAGFTPCDSVQTDPVNHDDTCIYSFAAGDTLTFTLKDFNAVRAQTSLEVRYLTYTLQYFVTGSTNMKDILVAGNASVGLALTGAAANILGDQLLPAQSTSSVTISWQSILGMVSGILSIADGIPGLTDLASPNTFAKLSANLQYEVKVAGSMANELSGAASLASGAGTIKSTTTQTPLPGKYSKFATTIGNLANGALQNQLAHGFDASVDSITSDWNRIAAIGPRVVDTADLAFFAINQQTQQIAADALTAGANRNFYMALLPQFFEVHYWPNVSNATNEGQPSDSLGGIPQPDMGYYQDHATGGATCSAFYLTPQIQTSSQVGVIPPNVSVFYSSAGNAPVSFPGESGGVDYWLIAHAPSSPGSDTEAIEVLPAATAFEMFDRSQLNIPMIQYVQSNGPMSYEAATSHFYDASTSTHITTHHNSQICSAYDYKEQVGGTNTGVGRTQTIDPNIVETTTTLQSPSSAVVGQPVTLQANVVSGSTPVPAGIMYFAVDGQDLPGVALNANGSASTTLNDLSLGAHTIIAKYGMAGNWDSSSSPTELLTVYGSSPDIAVTASASTLSVARGSTSGAVKIDVTSSYGAAGNVSFSCSGLPVGATCSFSPAQMSLTDGGSITTSMTITVQRTAAGAAFGALLLPFFALKSRAKRVLPLAACLVLIAVTAGSISGCGDDQTYSEVRTGTTTVLVSATVNGMTRSTPIQVTIQ